MKHSWFAILAAVGVLVLAGCHADITYRFDVHPNRTVTVTVKELIDDQFYQLAVSQNPSDDPFEFRTAKNDGWVIARSIDQNGNHSIIATKTVPLNQIQGKDALPGLMDSKSSPIHFAELKKSNGLFVDTSTLQETIPAPMSNARLQSADAMAAAGASMAASMISMRLDLRMPGWVTATNGERMADGYTRWTIDLRHPTVIRYTAQTPDSAHIVIAVVLAIVLTLLAALTGRAGLQRRRT